MEPISATLSAIGLTDAAATTAAAGTAAATTAASTAAAGAGTLASSIAAASPYLTAASAGIGALGALSSASQQSAALKYNQQVDQVNAGSAMTAAEAQAQRDQINARRTVAQTQNTYGAAGVNEATGSPLDVLADQSAQGALNAEIARWRGSTQATSDINAGTQAAYQAGQAGTAGAITAGSTLLTAGARYATGQLPRAAGNLGVQTLY